MMAMGSELLRAEECSPTLCAPGLCPWSCYPQLGQEQPLQDGEAQTLTLGPRERPTADVCPRVQL